MKRALQFLLPALAAGVLVSSGPIAAQSQPQRRHKAVAQRGPLQGTTHYSHPVARQPYFKPVNPIPKPGIMPAYVHPPSYYGPPVTGYGVYPNIRYFRRHGHVYAHDYATNETYLVQW